MAAPKFASWMTVRREGDFADDRVISLNQMRKAGTFTDFVISVEGEKIAAHRLILAAASPYFRGMFSHEMKENQSGEVQLDAFKAKVVNDLIDYCYFGELDVPWDSVKLYFEAAQYFQLMELNVKFDTFISKNMQAGNCISFYLFADGYELPNTKGTASRMLITKFKEISQLDEFQQLTVGKFKDLVKEVAAFENGDVLLQAFIKWIMGEEESRKHYFSEILQHARLETCSSGYLKAVLQKYENTLLANRELYVQITKTMMANACVPEAKEIDNSLLIFSGYSTDMNVAVRSFDKCWRVIPESGNCEEVLLLPEVVKMSIQPSIYALCSTHNGIFVTGHTIESSSSTECFQLHTKTLKWTQLPNIPSLVSNASAVCVEDEVYIMGGYYNRDSIMECIDLFSHQWRSCPNLLQGMKSPIVVAVNHLILVLFHTEPTNGNMRCSEEISLQCYDTQARTWSFRAPLPDTISDTTRGTCAVTVGSQMYVVGGKNKLCARYDPQQDSWTALHKSVRAHYVGAALYMGSRIILCGGRNTSIEAYDVQKDKWKTTKAKLPLPLFGLSMTKL